MPPPSRPTSGADNVSSQVIVEPLLPIRSASTSEVNVVESLKMSESSPLDSPISQSVPEDDDVD
ncbi:hypothetical protein L0668_10310 [Paraglaciecola aquimarina]|uniref:Uncharacterized protein n=1 Tax=Paraglaciecola algarum TaxID=3050085 RepID=A0ABS9D752_9ALTE|nr:hypothetical protein [Paraglaciecola sp. G1-23]MCF2948499.1 hypothetical protein [Paraglaciecola sp. G1-23]